MVGYNVQTAVDTTHHLIVAHEVTNVGSDRSQLANMATKAKATLETESLDVVADPRLLQQRGDFGVRTGGRHGRLAQADDLGSKVRRARSASRTFAMWPDDAYICPAGERLTYRYTNEEHGLVLRRYWTSVCGACAIKPQCTPGVQRRVTRWEHEHLLEAVQRRLDADPGKMRMRRETVEHPFGTIKARMGATHFPDEDDAARRHRDGAARARL